MEKVEVFPRIMKWVRTEATKDVNGCLIKDVISHLTGMMESVGPDAIVELEVEEEWGESGAIFVSIQRLETDEEYNLRAQKILDAKAKRAEREERNKKEISKSPSTIQLGTASPVWLGETFYNADIQRVPFLRHLVVSPTSDQES